MTALGRTALIDALALLDRLALDGGVRERIAVAARVAGWLPAEAPVVLPDGASWPEPGQALGVALVSDGREAALWLLDGARLLVAEGAPGAPPRTCDLADAPLAPEVLADRLRRALLERHRAEVGLEGLAGDTRQAAVADWIALAWSVDGAARAWLVAALAETMRPDWVDEAARLKTAFERGLGDRHEGALAAVRGLVRMAAYGPRPPYLADRPAKLLDVVFAVPRADLRRDGLEALAALPAEALEALADAAEPIARAHLVHDDPEVREAAGALQARLAAGDTSDLALELAAAEPARRVAALEAFRDQPDARVGLVPRVLAALVDPEPAVRAAARAACAPLLAGDDPAARDLTLAALLGGATEDVVQAGVDALPADPASWPAVAEPALRRALDGPPGVRRAVVERLADVAAAAAPDEAAAAYAALMRHLDPLVRQTALRRLARDAAHRAAVQDRLTHDLVAHLHGDAVPELRAEVARTLVALGFPNAVGLAAQLAADPHPVARQGALAALRAAGDSAALAAAERTAEAVAALHDLPAAEDAAGRARWAAALADFAARPTPRRLEVLVGLLRAIPADVSDAFTRQAVAELDRHALALAAEGEGAPEGVTSLCRRLVEPPRPAPAHAARLAGAVAAEDPRALDFLWSLYCGSSGVAEEAARRALAALTGRHASPAVREWLADARAAEVDPGRRDALATLASGLR